LKRTLAGEGDRMSDQLLDLYEQASAWTATKVSGATTDLGTVTVARGRQQLLDQNVSTGRTRRSGGGRKPVEKKPPTSSR